MSYFDLSLVAIVIGFGLFGLWFGLVHTFGSLLGTAVGLFLASRYYEPMANWLASVTGWTGNFSKVLMFIIAFVLITRLVGFVFWILEKTLGIFTKLPFIRGFNHLLGALFGVFEGIILIGASLYFIARFPLGQNFMNSLGSSNLAPVLVNPVKILMPVIPDAIKFLQSTVQSIF
ncbi:MAG: CvpA family protein [bacterium]